MIDFFSKKEKPSKGICPVITTFVPDDPFSSKGHIMEITLYSMYSDNMHVDLEIYPAQIKKRGNDEYVQFRPGVTAWTAYLTRHGGVRERLYLSSRKDDFKEEVLSPELSQNLWRLADFLEQKYSTIKTPNYHGLVHSYDSHQHGIPIRELS